MAPPRRVRKIRRAAPMIIRRETTARIGPGGVSMGDCLGVDSGKTHWLQTFWLREEVPRLLQGLSDVRMSGLMMRKHTDRY